MSDKYLGNGLSINFAENKFLSYSVYLSICIWIFLVVRFIAVGGVVVSEIDEVPYYNSSKIFASKFSLKSTGMIEEEVSKLSESDWYGPGYPLLYGSFRIILGNADKSFIYTNIILIFAILLIISRFGIDVSEKAWLWLVILLCPSVLNYSFMFMPVILELTITSILTLMLFKINSAYPNSSIRRKGMIFLIAVLIAGLIKQNFLFFSIGILFFSENKKWFLIWLSGIAISFLAVMKYNSLFAAPAFGDDLKILTEYLSSFQFGKFLGKAFNNMFLNLLHFKSNLVYFVPYYIVLLSIPVVLLNMKEKSRLVYAFASISLLSLISLLMLYTTDWPYFVRISAPLVFVNCLSVIFLVSRYKSKLKILILAAFILSFPLSVNQVLSTQNTKSKNYEYVNSGMPKLSQIVSLVDPEKMNTILIDPEFYQIYGFEQFLIALPIETDKNIIRYTANYRLKDKFARLKKIEVDYVITPVPVNIANTSLVEQNEYYCFYKFTD